MKKEKLTFEYAMARLEEIAGKLENGEESLESSMELYQEALDLGNYCKETLESAQQKITVLELK